MTVTVRFFAWLRERAGVERLEVKLEGAATVRELALELARQKPALADDLRTLPVVVDGEVASPESRLHEGAEVAWLPPVAGGIDGGVIEARLTAELIDAETLTRAVQHATAGAVAVFHGVVRDHEGERTVERLEYEAYPELAEKRLRQVAEEAVARWPEARVAVVHRTGSLAVGETSVVVAVATPHRAEAFECCRFVMERVKVAVPIWKKSFGPGGATWVEGAPFDAGA